jgi:hypothetical protein
VVTFVWAADRWGGAFTIPMGRGRGGNRAQVTHLIKGEGEGCSEEKQ